MSGCPFAAAMRRGVFEFSFLASMPGGGCWARRMATPVRLPALAVSWSPGHFSFCVCAQTPPYWRMTVCVSALLLFMARSNGVWSLLFCGLTSAPLPSRIRANA